MQTVPRETRRVVWETRMSFNAVEILTDEKTGELTDASREIYPMQRVDTDKNAHLRGDNDYVCAPAEHKGRLIGCGDFETTEGLRADPPAGNVDSHNIFCSWYPQAHVSIHSCDFTCGNSQGQKIDRILLYRMPKIRSYKWSNFGFASTHQLYNGAKAKAMNSVLQKLLIGKEEHKAKTNTERAQPITHDARYCLTRKASASKVRQ